MLSDSNLTLCIVSLGHNEESIIFGDLDLIFKVTICKHQPFLSSYLMNQCMDFLQTYIDTLFGEGKELLDFGDLDLIFKVSECSGSVVKCLTQDRGVVGSSLTSITALCP